MTAAKIGTPQTVAPPLAGPGGGAPPKDQAIVFSKVSQLFEIFSEVDRLKLPVLLRYSRSGKAVRAVFQHFDIGSASLTLSGISQAGMEFIGSSSVLKVEFVLLSKKIVFVSSVVSRGLSDVTLKLPDKLVAIERRQNVRFKVPINCPAFIEFPDRRIRFEDEGAPYYPKGLETSARSTAILRIDDVSLGGIGGITRYASIANAMRVGDDMQNAVLYFPDNYPVSLPVSVRWNKKTIVSDLDGRFDEFKKRVARFVGSAVSESDIEIKESFHRVGVQFAEVSKDLDNLLRSFIKRVQQAESV